MPVVTYTAGNLTNLCKSVSFLTFKLKPWEHFFVIMKNRIVEGLKTSEIVGKWSIETTDDYLLHVVYQPMRLEVEIKAHVGEPSYYDVKLKLLMVDLKKLLVFWRTELNYTDDFRLALEGVTTQLAGLAEALAVKLPERT